MEHLEHDASGAWDLESRSARRKPAAVAVLVMALFVWAGGCVVPPGPPLNDPVIGAAGDIACDPVADAAALADGRRGVGDVCRQTGTAAVLSGQVDHVLTLGDNQYAFGAASAFAGSYDVDWGSFKPITHPTPGNHDYYTTGAAGYYGYFGTAAGDPTKGYYSYDVGTWHIVALNSNCAAVGGCGAGSPEEQWLRADLAAHPATCTLAYWHHPRFSSGEHGSDVTYTAFWQALYDLRADVVLSSHDHDYERFGLQDPAGNADTARGLREFVVGTGGKSHYPMTVARPNSEVFNGATYGALKLTLHPKGYDWSFVPASGYTFADSGTGTCQ